MTHRQAVRSALRVNEGMGVLFARLGSRQYPRGAVWAAYVRATRQLRDILASGGTPARAGTWRSSVQVAQAGDVLRQLRMEVALGVQPVLQDAATLGALQALAQLRAYGLQPPVSATPPASEASEGLQVVLATVDAQVAAATALLVTGAQPEMITGTDERQGPLSAAAVITPATLWVGATALAGWGWAVGLYGGGGPGQQPWLKQAVAAIDERTTECCLRVHGQVVPLDGMFHLTGQPRFAEYKDAPPFHWRCRSATALVRPEDAGDALTDEMVSAARAELLARAETGGRVEIDPASATSRRRRQGDRVTR